MPHDWLADIVDWLRKAAAFFNAGEVADGCECLEEAQKCVRRMKKDG